MAPTDTLSRTVIAVLRASCIAPTIAFVLDGVLMGAEDWAYLTNGIFEPISGHKPDVAVCWLTKPPKPRTANT